jgi:hypothetical protein
MKWLAEERCGADGEVRLKAEVARKEWVDRVEMGGGLATGRWKGKKKGPLN